MFSRFPSNFLNCPECFVTDSVRHGYRLLELLHDIELISGEKQ